MRFYVNGNDQGSTLEQHRALVAEIRKKQMIDLTLKVTSTGSSAGKKERADFLQRTGSRS